MKQNIIFIWPLPGSDTLKDGYTFNLVEDEPRPTAIHLDGITEDIEERKITRAAYIISDDDSIEFLKDFSDPSFDSMFRIWDNKVGPGEDGISPDVMDVENGL
jgi:hypothetical protein